MTHIKDTARDVKCIHAQACYNPPTSVIQLAHKRALSFLEINEILQ